MISTNRYQTFSSIRNPYSCLVVMERSNGIRWTSYVDKNDVPIIREYLENDGLDSDAVVNFSGLMQDTDMGMPPERNWYKLHLLTSNDKSTRTTDSLWPLNVVAWGLNIWLEDLVKLLRGLSEQHVPFRCEVSQSHDRLPAYRSVEESYDVLPARFSRISTKKLNYQWYMSAMHHITVLSWKRSFWDVQEGRYDSKSGSISMKGHMYWTSAYYHAASEDEKYGHFKDAVPTRLRSGGDEGVPYAGVQGKRKRGEDDLEDLEDEFIKRAKGNTHMDTMNSAGSPYGEDEHKSVYTSAQKRGRKLEDDGTDQPSKRSKGNGFQEATNPRGPLTREDENGSGSTSGKKRKNDDMDEKSDEEYKRCRIDI